MHGLIIAKLKPNKIIAKMLTGNAVLGLKSDRLDRDWCVSCKVSKASSQTWIKPRVQSGLPQLREFDQSESFLVRDHHLFYTIEYCIFIFLCVCWELIITIRPRVQGYTLSDKTSVSQLPNTIQMPASGFLFPDPQNKASIKSPTKDRTTVKYISHQVEIRLTFLFKNVKNIKLSNY